MKTHPSTHETDVANEQQYQTARDSAHFQNEKDIESLKEAIATNRSNATIAAENKRSAANNATSLKVAGIDHSVQAQALADRQRTEFFDSALAAAGGDAVQAMSNVEKYQMPQARKFGATRSDYHAAAARYRDSKAVLTREQIDAANERAAGRSGTQMLPRDLNGQPIPPPPAPAGTGGKSGNISLPVNSRPAQPTPAATPNTAGPTSAFPPEQAQAIGTLAAGIRAGHATLDQLRGKVPDAVYQAVAKLRALTAEEKNQAQKDPQFRAYLQKLGYDDSEL